MDRKWRMEDVKHAGLLFSLISILFGCGSAPMQHDDTINYTYSLDSAINEGSEYLVSRIAVNSKIAVVNVQSPTINLTNYVIDHLLMHLVNNDNFMVIERSEINTLEKEQHYQLSGAVSDETAVSLGKQLGTQFIISGSMLPLGDKYSLRLKVINVETAQIMGTNIFHINTDNTLMALLVTQNEETLAKDNAKQSTIIHGDINITNNNTTTIQGDVYVNIPRGIK